MKINQLLKDDRGVSPVIGVILMVAITVILAAVIGTFVLGLGDNLQNTSPQASFEFDYTQDASGDTLEIVHASGDTIDGSNLNATVSGAMNTTGSPSEAASISSDQFTGTVNAGASETLQGSDFSSANNISDLDLSGATVRVTWSGESGDNSAVLGKWSGPDA